MPQRPSKLLVGGDCGAAYYTLARGDADQQAVHIEKDRARFRER